MQDQLIMGGVKQSSTLQFTDKLNVISGQDIIEFADEIKRLGAQHAHLVVNVSRQEWERGPVGGGGSSTPSTSWSPSLNGSVSDDRQADRL